MLNDLIYTNTLTAQQCELLQFIFFLVLIIFLILLFFVLIIPSFKKYIYIYLPMLQWLDKVFFFGKYLPSLYMVMWIKST